MKIDKIIAGMLKWLGFSVLYPHQSSVYQTNLQSCLKCLNLMTLFIAFNNTVSSRSGQVPSFRLTNPTANLYEGFLNAFSSTSIFPRILSYRSCYFSKPSHQKCSAIYIYLYPQVLPSALWHILHTSSHSTVHSTKQDCKTTQKNQLLAIAYSVSHLDLPTILLANHHQCHILSILAISIYFSGRSTSNSRSIGQQHTRSAQNKSNVQLQNTSKYRL